jgi:hypothetical protein
MQWACQEEVRYMTRDRRGNRRMADHKVNRLSIREVLWDRQAKE